MKRIKIILGIYGVLITSLLLWAGFKNINTPSSFFVIPLLFIILIDYPLSLLSWSKIRSYKIVLFIVGFLASTIILVAEAAAIKTVRDFIFTLVFFPVFLNFLLTFIVGLFSQVRKIHNRDQNVAIPTLIFVKEEVVEDENRRRFLKVLAATGMGAVLFSIMNPKKVGAAFFGSIPGPGTIFIKDSGGVKIDPAIKSPTDSYGVTNIADSGDYPYYYGFEHYNGTEWYILNEASNGTFSYASKLNNVGVDYSTAWSTKEDTLIFGSYYEAF